jgi:hypothetical protein
MSQSTPTIGSGKSGLAYRQEDNDGKKALLNHHKGSVAPSYAEAGLLWLDDAATPWALKIYDGTDWIKIADVNATANTVTPYLGASALKLLGYASDTGSANAYAVAPAPAISAYGAGQMVVLKPGNANTGASTLAVSGLSATAVKMQDGTDTPSGVLKSTGVYILVHNGTNFTVLNPTMAQGGLVDTAVATYATSTGMSTALPRDDTVPQSSEGTEILSASLTPKSSTNKVRVSFTGFGSPNSAVAISAALFIDSTASALTATSTSFAAADTHSVISFMFEHTPGDTNAHTYKVRVGPSSGAIIRMNGNSAGRYFGGIAACTLRIEEISA